MQRRHDRPAQTQLDSDAVRVHGDVHQAVGETEQRQRRDEHAKAGRQRRRGQGKTQCEAGGARDRCAAEVRDHPSGSRHCAQGTHGGREQRRAEGSRGQAEPLLDERNLRRPAAEDGTIGKEDQTDRDAGAP